MNCILTFWSKISHNFLLVLSFFLVAMECKAQNENGNDFLLSIDRTLPKTESEKITIHFKDKSSLKLSDYPNIKYSSMWPAETLRQILIDLDGDGSKELIVQHFSDGAHRSSASFLHLQSIQKDR